MATHFSILAWKILWTEEPVGPQSRSHKESDMIDHTHTRHNQAPPRLHFKEGLLSQTLASSLFRASSVAPTYSSDGSRSLVANIQWQVTTRYQGLPFWPNFRSF